MSARGRTRSDGTRTGTRARTGRLSFQRQIERVEEIARANQQMFTNFSIQTAENNRRIRELLTRGFTSKREGRDVSPAVKEQLEALQQVLLKHQRTYEPLLEQIAEILDDAVLLTTKDIKDAKREEDDNKFLRKLTTRLKKRLATKHSPTRGGRKTRKNRGKKQKTQKRKHHNKKRKQTQRRKQHKKK